MNRKSEKARFTFHAARTTTSQALTVASRFRLVGILLFLVLPALACGIINPRYQLNNEVRLAVYEYEREARGPVDDLVIDFERDEPRIKFEGQSENGGRTVWLYRLGAKEFFAQRPPEDTYLYIQKIEYNNDRSSAAVNVFRGDGRGYEGRLLALIRDEGHHWSVINEVELEPD
jgi:hypothetical protein